MRVAADVVWDRWTTVFFDIDDNATTEQIEQAALKAAERLNGLNIWKNGEKSLYLWTVADENEPSS